MTKIIKKVLLCPPDYFQVRYQINPWMRPGSVDQAKAKEQWLTLLNLFRSLGVKAETVKPQPDLPDMVFSADQALIKGEKAILANFRFKQRRGEGKIYRQWLENNGFRIFSLPAFSYFEGGDALEADNKVILGYGFRTSFQTAKIISNLLKIPVITLKLVNPYFYHLDTCLFIVNQKTAFYYPPAFDKNSKTKLASLFTNLIPLPENEASALAANSLITDHQAIVPQGSPFLAKNLQKFGYRVHRVNISQFLKAGGGIHCLTITTHTQLTN